MNKQNSNLKDFQRIVGENNVLYKEIALRLYSYDAALDRAYPTAVIFPENKEQISAIVKICYKNKIPFVARGAGTNLCGGTIPLQQAVVIAPTRMNKIISIDPEKKCAVVEPGVPNLFLKKALEPYRLYYAPDPASQKACTIGGNIGTNAGGPHCLKYGVTSQHVLALEMVLPNGEITELKVLQKGYDLVGLMVGSEGTLGIVTQATLNLLTLPAKVETMLVSFPSLEAAIQTVTDIISSGIIPATLEAMDKITVQAVEAFIHAGYPTNAEAVLLIEVDGGEEIHEDVTKIRELCKKNLCQEFRLAQNKLEREKLWEGRRGSYPAMARLSPNVLVEDGAVPRNKLPLAQHRIRKIAEENNLNLSLIFHAGDGNLHPQILFDERNLEETKKVKKAGTDMLKVCIDLGGTISGEHGIGMDKKEAMRWLFTQETLELFRRIKQAFDPDNLCNPDKLIPTKDAKEVLFREQKNQKKISENDLLLPSKKETNPITQTSPTFLVPKDEKEACSFLKNIWLDQKKVLIQGLGNSLKKHSLTPDILFCTKNLNKILEHDVENFTVTVEAGIKVGDLQNILYEKRQKILFSSLEKSVGGTLALNLNQTPFLRDQLLGIKLALADGNVVQFGAKVMKNVAGYDAGKLLLGARGGLGVILSVILKTFPLNYPIQAQPKPDQREIVENNIPENMLEIYKKIKNSFDPKGIFYELPVFRS
ncbi:MAG: FAD-binding protein [Elusimicrobia bacterium]|nr:FAD-binding protein [Elusimicrobiota bacterium]